jgi:hypothetical protein
MQPAQLLLLVIGELLVVSLLQTVAHCSHVAQPPPSFAAETAHPPCSCIPSAAA